MLPEPVPTLSDDLIGPDDGGRERRLSWSSLMRRTYAVEVLVCTKCSGPMRVIAYIENEGVARRILAHLGLPTTPPTFAAARAPPQTQFDWGNEGEGNPEPDYAWVDPIPTDFH